MLLKRNKFYVINAQLKNNSLCYKLFKNKNEIFSSFEFGNCVNNSSFKWMINRNKQFSCTEVNGWFFKRRKCFGTTRFKNLPYGYTNLNNFHSLEVVFFFIQSQSLMSVNVIRWLSAERVRLAFRKSYVELLSHVTSQRMDIQSSALFIISWRQKPTFHIVLTVV